MPIESQPSLYEVLLADLRCWNKTQRTGWLTIIGHILIRPDYMAVALYRFGSRCACKGKIGKKFAAFIRHANLHLNACDIDPGAMIGPGFRLPHPVGVVIGRATIGRNATIHQNSTLGISRLGDSFDDPANFPVVGDDVVVWAGAVLAGKIRIGNNAIIGANAVVLQDVPDDCAAVGVAARVIAKSAEGLSPKSD